MAVPTVITLGLGRELTSRWVSGLYYQVWALVYRFQLDIGRITRLWFMWLCFDGATLASSFKRNLNNLKWSLNVWLRWLDLSIIFRFCLIKK